MIFFKYSMVPTISEAVTKYVRFSVCVSVSLSVCLSLFLCVYMSVFNVSVRLSAFLCVCPSFCVSVFSLPTCLSVCLAAFEKKCAVARFFYNCLDLHVKPFYQAAHLHFCHPETLQILANCLLNITPK